MRHSVWVLRRFIFLPVVLLGIGSLLGFTNPSAKTQRPETHLVVLCYHHFDQAQKTSYSISESLFVKQLDALTEKGFRFVSLQDVDDYYYRNKPLPPKAALLTFDDGNRSVYLTAYPILRARAIPWALFVYPTAIFAGPKRGFMSWEEVKEVSEHGATIGCHAMWHPYLTDHVKEKDPDAWLNTQIVESRKLIEKQIGKPVQGFAVPFGLWDSIVAEKIRSAGYRLVFNVNNSNNNKDSSPLDLNRQIIGAREPMSYFTSRIVTKRMTTRVTAPGNLDIVDTPGMTLRITIPEAHKFERGELILQEPNLGKVVLVPKNGIAEVPVTLGRPGQYIPHISGRNAQGESFDDSWSFVYRKSRG